MQNKDWGAVAYTIATSAQTEVPTRRVAEAMLILGFDVTLNPDNTVAALTPDSVDIAQLLSYHQHFAESGNNTSEGYSSVIQQAFASYFIEHGFTNGTTYHDYFVGEGLDNLPTDYQQLLGQFDLIRTIRDPLVVDLNGDGRATVVNSSVYFDLDSDGSFSEAVHLWAAPQDGMIVVDLNNNDRADSGAELFSDVSAWNALRAYDLNGDHIINASDAVWTQLHVWQDKNADGATQADEWFSMAELGISTITPPSVGETGSITTTTGTSVVTAYNFTTDTRNTIYTGDTPVDFATLFLPALRGYSTLPDLRAAMSMDNTGTDSLLNNVAALAAVNDNAPLLLTSNNVFKIAA